MQPPNLRPLPECPLVSVLIPNFNYGHFIASAIDSCLGQTYENVEIVVCDDGSTDDSATVLARYDGKVTAILKENGGPASAINAAFERSRGELVALLDADDWFAPEKIRRAVEAFRANPAAAMVIHPLQNVTAEGAPLDVYGTLPSGWLGDRALEQGGRVTMPGMGGVVVRRDALEPAMPMPVDLDRVGDGYVVGVAQFYGEVEPINEVLTYRRLHGSNIGAAVAFDERRIANTAVDYRLILDSQRAFVAREFGPEVAARLRLDDLKEFWSNLLALHVLTDGRHPLVEGYGHGWLDLLAHLPDRERRPWRILHALPGPVARRALREWWSPPSASRLKRMLRA